MFQLSGKLKLFSIILVVLGIIGVVYSFISVPSSPDEIKEIVMANESKILADKGQPVDLLIEKNKFIDDLHLNQPAFTDRAIKSFDVNFLPTDTYLEKAERQIKTRPWAGTFTAAFFFFMIALGALVFHAIQYASRAGWSPLLYRVFEGITSYVLPGSLIVAALVILAGNYFYPWQNSDLVAQDEILQIKSVYLNYPFFLVRLLIYLLIWNVYRYYQRRHSLAQVDPNDHTHINKNYNMSIWFLVLFGASESTMVWDWFMSMNPHWYSALYAWYIFASMFVAAITTITLITLYLKKKGYLDFINTSHIHDLAKYMFAFSIFWTYLWFSQFMLIWYANIPEEAAHFVMLIQHYRVLFFGVLIINFVFPIVILMNTDFKRISWIINFVGVFILIGHYIVIYLEVIPSTMGVYGSFGIPEIAPILLFLGLFIYIVGTGLGSVPLRNTGDPYITESENFEY